MVILCNHVKKNTLAVVKHEYKRIKSNSVSSAKIRKCAQCDEPITGRADKRFCSDQCRFLYNSSKRLKAEAPILKANSTLRKNRSILKSLCPEGKATVKREVMEAMGYDFTMFSSVFTTRRGMYYICYEYAFTPIVEGTTEKALIVTHQAYMKANDPWQHLRAESEDDDSDYFL